MLFDDRNSILDSSMGRKVTTRRRFLQFFAGTAAVTTAKTPQTLSAVEVTQKAQFRQVEVTVSVNGQLRTRLGGKLRTPALSVAGRFRFDERLDIGNKGTRVVRDYETAEAKIVVNKHPFTSKLAPRHRIVAGRVDKDRVVLFSPDGPMARDELDLLQVPGDSIGWSQLLPGGVVNAEKKWQLPSAALCVLLGIDAVNQSSVVCELKSVAGARRVEIRGTVDGAAGGVATTIRIEGHLSLHASRKRITGLSLDVREKRAIGHAEPGFEVHAKVVIKAKELNELPRLTEVATRLGNSATDAALLIDYRAERGGFALLHDRGWHVMVDDRELSVMRLVERGDLVAQCNISRLPAASETDVLQLSKYQVEIQRALKNQFSGFVEASEGMTDTGLRILKVAVAGTASDLPIRWIYYHISDKQGRRVSIVFAHEAKLERKFAGMDDTLISSFRFVEPMPAPAKKQNEVRVSQKPE